MTTSFYSQLKLRIGKRARRGPHIACRWDIRSCVCRTLCTWPCVHIPEAHSQSASPYRSYTGFLPWWLLLYILYVTQEKIQKNKNTWKSFNFCKNIIIIYYTGSAFISNFISLLRLCALQSKKNKTFIFYCNEHKTAQEYSSCSTCFLFSYISKTKTTLVTVK